MFNEKEVLKNFAKLTGKHLCQSLIFNKAADLRPATLFLKKSPTRVFSCQFKDIIENAFFTEYFQVTAFE